MSISIQNRKKMKIGIIFVLMFFLISCSKKSENRPDLNQTISNLKELSKNAKHLTDIFTPTDTINFEYSKNSAFGAISQICKHPKGYLVLDHFYSREVYLFDENGRFIKKLGQKGEGPREYKMPTFIYIDNNGNSFILDQTLRKIVAFDRNGSYTADITFGSLNINPSSFAVRYSNGQIEFILYDPNNSKINKIYMADYKNGVLTILNSYGKTEDLMVRLPYLSAPLGLTSIGTIWTGHCFDLDIDIYSSDGKEHKIITDHKMMLPAPHISPEYFKGFNRLSESIDTYYKYTRLFKLYFLKDLVIGSYWGPHNQKENHYFTFWDNNGNPLHIILKDGKNIFILGSYDNEIYVYSDMENSEMEEDSNPSMIIYKVRNN